MMMNMFNNNNKISLLELQKINNKMGVFIGPIVLFSTFLDSSLIFLFGKGRNWLANLFGTLNINSQNLKGIMNINIRTIFNKTKTHFQMNNFIS